jgi:hypothetical protein
MSQDNVWRQFNSDSPKSFLDFSVRAAGREAEYKLTAAVTANVITITPAVVTGSDFEAMKFVVAGADSSQTISTNLNVGTPAAVVIDYSALTPLKDYIGRPYVRLNVTPYPKEGREQTGLGNTAERNLYIGVNLTSFTLVDSKDE